MRPESTPAQFCISCGYSLQGLPALPAGQRCPECGRQYDPTDPKSFSTSPHSPLTRWLAKPIGWPLVFLSLIAAVGVMSVSRWKISTFDPSTVDLVYYLHPSALRHRTSLETWRDYVFTCSMLVAIGAAVWWMLRVSVGMFVRWRAGFVADEKPVHAGRRHALLAIASVVTAGGAALGWPYRLAQQWVAKRLAANSLKLQPQFQPPPPLMPPTILSPEQTQATLRIAVIELPQAAQRIAGLKLLIEDHPGIALPILSEAVMRESDSEVRALELRMIGLLRDVNTVELLMRFMTHADANTRAAAADALGLIHAPVFPIPLSQDFWGQWVPSVHPAVATTGPIPIDLGNLVARNPDPSAHFQQLLNSEIPLGLKIRDALERMMLAGPTTEEREAASRALVMWPPNSYALRAAEWGVWIADNGQLKLIQSVLDEIPPFVHRTGNPATEFQSRVNPIMIVTKPIIHITVDRPMAVDVNVLINRGRPWFAFPMPDDFAVTVEEIQNGGALSLQPPPFLSALDNPKLKSLKNIRQGYPWMTPEHISSGSIHGVGAPYNDVTSLGLRWQSVIVSPTQLSWMTVPEIGTDPRYFWWTRLRDVTSAWVSNRNETERFLYYDGPTLLPAPVAVTLTGNKLQMTLRGDDFERPYGRNPQGFLLIHHRNGQLSGQAIPLPTSWDLMEAPTISCDLRDDDLYGDQVIDKFRTILTAAGLTADEGEGLIVSWRGQFFQTDGTRILLIMSRLNYDQFCPIEIRPTPTELVRVGIVLTELA